MIGDFMEYVAEIDRLRAELAEAYRLRDAHHTDAINSRLETESVRAQLAEARAGREQIELANKEFGDQLAHAHVQLAEERARAERAEAKRDALHLFSGAQAAVIKEMREALQFALNFKITNSSGHEVAEDSLHEIRKRARAAVAPSPVLIDDLGQVWPEDAPAGREG